MAFRRSSNAQGVGIILGPSSDRNTLLGAHSWEPSQKEIRNRRHSVAVHVAEATLVKQADQLPCSAVSTGILSRRRGSSGRIQISQTCLRGRGHGVSWNEAGLWKWKVIAGADNTKNWSLLQARPIESVSPVWISLPLDLRYEVITS
jgi:hypothetical protein